MGSAAKKSDNNSDWVAEISRIVHEKAGIQLGTKQATMVQSRLTKRMLDLGIPSPTSYLQYVKDNPVTEVDALVSLLTTHHTFFFREFKQFEYLEQKILPDLIEKKRAQGNTTIKIWSAACSRGQEAYSLSMFLQVHLKRLAPEMKFEILGTDVDSESVQISKNGVYRWDEIKEIPSFYLSDHWVRGTGEISNFVKSKSTLKKSCRFLTMNLLDIPKSFNESFDIIFCRNVFIYFSPEQIKKVTTELLKRMSPDGALFLGLSESLNSLQLPVTLSGPSVYTRVQTASPKKKPDLALVPPVPAAPALPAVLKVLCVDDSPTILTLLKKILTPNLGYEVVGTAKNGLEAAAYLKNNKVDVVTLDIHMPEQNGVEYLEKNMNKDHPAVVMVSSVSREDSGLGVRSLEFGASDYVEKPGMNNLQEKGDELRTKLRCAVFSRLVSAARSVRLEQSFAKKFVPSKPQEQLRILICGPGDLKRIDQILSGLQMPHPPTVVLMSGSENLLSGLSRSIRTSRFRDLVFLSGSTPNLSVDTLYIGEQGRLNQLLEETKARTTVVMLLGDVTERLGSTLLNAKVALIVEDLGFAGSSFHEKLKRQARHVLPASSMSYHADEILDVESRK